MTSFSQGKIILSGEHSVVYGQLAILSSVEMGVSVAADQYSQSHNNLSGILSADPQSHQRDAYWQRILQLFCDFSGLKREDMQLSLTVKSDLPQRSGMGSSAAFAAAAFRELANFHHISLTNEQLYQLVVEAENFIHGHSSGADPAIVVYGGLISFIEGRVERLAPATLAERTFFLINSGAASESTGEMVSLVAQLPDRQAITAAIGSLTGNLLNDLLHNSFNSGLLSQNQLLLEQLGVVGSKAQSIIKQLQSWGVDCKITGAGGVKTGSGYILAYYFDPEQLASKLRASNWSYCSTKLGLRKELL